MSRTAKTHSATSYAPLQQRLSAQERAVQDKRRAAIKAIKTKQRQLAMDDPTYRAMLLALTGKTSSTACTLTELGTVSGYLTAQGAVPPRAVSKAGSSASGATQRRPVVAPERAALRAKVAALMAELRQVHAIADERAYVDAICRKNGWCSALDFADPHVLHKLVGALSRTLKARRTPEPRSA